MAMKKKDFLLGEALIRRGYVTLEQIEEALRQKGTRDEYFGQILITLGYIQEAQLIEILSDQLGIEYIRDLKNLQIDPEVLKKVPPKIVTHYQFMPIKIKKKTLTICIVNPLNFSLFDEIRTLLGYDLEITMSDSKSIEEAIKEHYGLGAGVVERLSLTKEFPKHAPVISAEAVDAKGEEASVIELVNQLLTDASKLGATDIHMEPYKDGFDIRYRIDGMLQPTKLPRKIADFQSSIISRIKIMADLDIAEKRLPQDGRILIKIHSGELDLRVSTLPSSYGEAVMIRILHPAMLTDLGKLGFAAGNLQLIQEAIQRPSGIILVTGPTGSGKTTTLYGCLSKMNTKEQKIITIEDPIEYEIKGILQINVQPKIGLNFATCLRHALRHDPDVMMVGEIRDTETAQIAARASLTGHLVLSTLHTRDACGAVHRLTDMGVEPYLVASSLEVVIAQRLVRTLCPHCKQEVSEEKKKLLKRLPVLQQDMTFYEGRGCEQCRKTGYQGRIAIQEILVMDDNLRELVVKEAPLPAFREAAFEKGMKGLWEDGIEKAAQGITSLYEVLRVASRNAQTE